MTREEAIKRLESIVIRDALQEDYDALDMAIEALESKAYIIQMSARGAGRSYFYERMKELYEGN